MKEEILKENIQNFSIFKALNDNVMNVFPN